jgi:hypothetical protein
MIMQLNWLVLFMFLFSAVGCAVETKPTQPEKVIGKDENVDLNSSELNEFKVTFSKKEGPENIELLSDSSEAINGSIKPKESFESSQNNLADATLINAKTGQCYAKLQIPALLNNKMHLFVKEAASYQLKIVEAEYAWEEEKVIVKEAREEISVKPATYKWINDKVLFSGEDGYKTVRKKVMVTPPEVIKNTIPAEYKTIKVKKLVKPAEIKRVEIAPVYEDVSVPVKLRNPTTEWREVLCANKVTSKFVYKLQNALRKSKHYTSGVDGKVGSKTLKAIQDFQKDNSLASGQLTVETVKALGIHDKSRRHFFKLSTEE